MKMKNIHSKDSRKKKVVAFFKKEFGCDKVTLLREDSDKFHGKMHKYAGRFYDPMGWGSVTKDLVEEKKWNTETS